MSKAELEIVEQTSHIYHMSAHEVNSVVLPNKVRINGVEVLVPKDEPIYLHEVTPTEPVKVTMTMFVDSVKIEREQV